LASGGQPDSLSSCAAISSCGSADSLAAQATSSWYSSGILLGLAPGLQCADTGAPSSVSESAEDIVSVRAAVPITNATKPVSTNVPITAGPTAAKKNRFT